jgi:hypothetical protein
LKHPDAHPGVFRQAVYGVLFGEVARIQSIKGHHPSTFPVSQHRPFNELRLLALTVRRHNQSARHAGGGLHAIVLPNDVKTKMMPAAVPAAAKGSLRNYRGT